MSRALRFRQAGKVPKTASTPHAGKGRTDLKPQREPSGAAPPEPAHEHSPVPPRARSARVNLFARILVNLAGAASAGFFARASLDFYLHTHRLIGGLFFIEHGWFTVAFLVRRPQRAFSRGLGSWLLASAGTFGALLFRPAGSHPQWGVDTGFALQVLGLVICVVSLLALGRSFGFVAADRGLKTRGPYAVVRHPVYASYLLIDGGYVFQTISARNVLILLAVSACNVGRALAEERLLTKSSAYSEYRRRVRWRLIPGIW
jgi:protein-S-isoprenylcysteine O-methyltransferase Ste14